MQWRPVKDGEYIYNWVEKLDLLCKPASHIGFLGSCLFIGIMLSIVWIPSVSDIYGRRLPILGALLAQLVAYLIVYLSNSLEVVYGGMILMGATFPGKHVVVYNYIMEVVPKRYGPQVVNWTRFNESCTIIALMTGYYNFVSKDCRWI